MLTVIILVILNVFVSYNHQYIYLEVGTRELNMIDIQYNKEHFVSLKIVYSSNLVLASTLNRGGKKSLQGLIDVQTKGMIVAYENHS